MIKNLGSMCKSMNELQFSIENGYLEIHLWCTYKCNVGCPHCYLKAMKQKAPDLTIEKYKQLIDSIKQYKQEWKKLRVVVYGAEPQSLPTSYYHELMDITDSYFNNAEYSMYTSLQILNKDWLNLFQRIKDKNGLSMTAVSYDGLMRGEKYNERLFSNLELLNQNKMRVGLMSVLNKTMIDLTTKHYVDVLEKYNLASFSIKPFLPIKGQRKTWEEWAVPMSTYSDYVIEVHEELRKRGLDKVSGMITDVSHVDTVSQSLGSWVVFVDGDLRLLYMGYDDREEYLQEFGRVNEFISFGDVIKLSPIRKKFLEDQRLLHNRLDCQTCEFAGKCLAEVYKDEYDDSNECIGAKRFVKWVYDNYGVLNETKI